MTSETKEGRTPTTLKEMAAAEARKRGYHSGTFGKDIAIEIYLAGAKATVDAAAESFEPNCNYPGYLVCSRIRALIPTE